jgi:hypothetical protein
VDIMGKILEFKSRPKKESKKINEGIRLEKMNNDYTALQIKIFNMKSDLELSEGYFELYKDSKTNIEIEFELKLLEQERTAIEEAEKELFEMEEYLYKYL